MPTPGNSSSPAPHPTGLRRRDVLRLGALGVAGTAVPGFFLRGAPAYGVPAATGLSDPALQPKFVELAPNALAPPFKYAPGRGVGNDGVYVISAKRASHQAGLVNPRSGKPLTTTIYGYGSGDYGPTWPGRTLDINREDEELVRVRWDNQLYGSHILPVDTSLHWCYSLTGYTQYTLKKDGVPMVPHVHGGHTDFQFDGNPEFFFSPDSEIVGPSWDPVPGGFTNEFTYDLRGDDFTTGAALWYHDHALGITRLNVYAGLAGFFFVRDAQDTGAADNPLGLPAYPYELAYAIQDRMFTDKGQLFYPAYPGDPAYDDFITGEGAILPPSLFPGGGPTALAEFFGDHIVVNGKIWPKENVEPRNYRMRLLNGCDSRFMVLQFVVVPAGHTDLTNAGDPVDFWVIGSDQGLGTPRATDTLVFEPGGRYDIVVDFSTVPEGSRVIMKNIGGDAPFGGAFGGDLDPDDLFPDRQTDRIMAFDVVVPVSGVADNFSPGNLVGYGGVPSDGATTRKVALFEGMDEFGRLQPLLGTVNEDGTATAYSWFQETTENPGLDSTEVWEIYNFTGDAHPVHLHLVNFEILKRQGITFDADEENPQMVPQHNGSNGTVAAISNVQTVGLEFDAESEYFQAAPKDMVTALPEQVVRVRAKFDKAGRYVWHCHILSHEDHEMMRVLQVGPAE